MLRADTKLMLRLRLVGWVMLGTGFASPGYAESAGLQDRQTRLCQSMYDDSLKELPSLPGVKAARERLESFFSKLLAEDRSELKAAFAASAKRGKEGIRRCIIEAARSHKDSRHCNPYGEKIWALLKKENGNSTRRRPGGIQLYPVGSGKLVVFGAIGPKGPYLKLEFDPRWTWADPAKLNAEISPTNEPTNSFAARTIIGVHSAFLPKTESVHAGLVRMLPASCSGLPVRSGKVPRFQIRASFEPSTRARTVVTPAGEGPAVSSEAGTGL